MPDRDPLLRALGVAVREARKRERLSQEALSLSTGVHRNYIGGLERAEREPTVRTIASLARGLGCNVSDLFIRAEAIMGTQTPA
jgi:transcriptional regulator with XRE-family HTH domain